MKAIARAEPISDRNEHGFGEVHFATSNKCLATSNKCLTSSNSNKKLLETSALLLVTIRM